MEDLTRECIHTIEEMYAGLDTIKGWKGQTATDSLLAEIKAFSDRAKTIRLYYNNALASATQSQFITEEIQDKLVAVEETLRAVKVEFNIPIVAKELKLSANSAHRTEYTARIGLFNRNALFFGNAVFGCLNQILCRSYNANNREDTKRNGEIALTASALSATNPMER
jgi:hypothetical protein